MGTTSETDSMGRIPQHRTAREIKTRRMAMKRRTLAEGIRILYSHCPISVGKTGFEILTDPPVEMHPIHPLAGGKLMINEL
jgi:hypothetical protein